MSEKVAFIGLGVMGAPMAAHLLQAGHEVVVFNRTLATARQWVDKHGGRAAERPRDAAKDAAFVFCCVGDDSHLRAVTVGPEGAFEGMAPGSLFIDHTTASADIARELAGVARDAGCGFMDEPVSGGQDGALGGTLTVMVGGAADDLERARPLL